MDLEDEEGGVEGDFWAMLTRQVVLVSAVEIISSADDFSAYMEE